VLPGLYRAAAEDEGASARWQVLASTASRPLIALLVDPDETPEPAVIELSGMIGNRDVVPVLLRLTRPDGPENQNPRRGLDAESRDLPGNAAQADRVVLAAVIALGRLQARPSLQRLLELSEHPEAKLRAAAVWALGRLEVEEALSRLSAAIRDPREEVAAFAALGLGRLGTIRPVALLRTVAFDASAPIDVRRAALLALARAGAPDASGGALLALLDAPEPRLARAAAFTLGVLRDRMTLSALWRRALLGGGQAQAVAVLALSAMAAEAVVADDARAIRGSSLDAPELLDDLCAFPAEAGTQMELLWLEHAAEIGEIFERALRGGTEERRRALLALDSRPAGVGLGRLARGEVVLSARAERALDQIGNVVREPVGQLLSDPDAAIRLRALRLASKLADPRVTTTHIVAALRDAADRARSFTGGALEPGRVAVDALGALKARGRVDSAGLWREARLLLEHPAWPVRLATIEALRTSGPTPPDLVEKALRDASPLCRAAARQLGGAVPPP
jgi:HEAT repeat protein